jgi:FSR family fosmidomycin resistance protein-like MFS transporter
MTVGAIPAFLPLYTAAFALSDLAAAMILGASTFSSSAVQPLFGLLADRRAAPWLLWGGVAVAAAGLAAAGLVAGYAGLIACIVGSGIGVAAYHPEAARVANRLAGARKATGVAWFTVGGNLGFAVGPLLAGLFIPLLDARATLVFLVPAAVACALLVARRARVALPVARHDPVAGAGRSHVPGISLLVVVVSLRTWAQFGLLALAPLVLTEQRGWSDRATGFALFAFTMAGAVGTLAGAVVADRLGGRRMLGGSLPLAAPAMAGFVLLDGAASIACLTLAGFVLLASFSVTVVMGQEYLPRRHALAAGLMIGFAAIGVATPGLALLGAVADTWSRDDALLVAAAFPLVAALLAALLPRPRPA